MRQLLRLAGKRSSIVPAIFTQATSGTYVWKCGVQDCLEVLAIVRPPQEVTYTHYEHGAPGPGERKMEHRRAYLDLASATVQRRDGVWVAGKRRARRLMRAARRERLDQLRAPGRPVQPPTPSETQLIKSGQPSEPVTIIAADLPIVVQCSNCKCRKLSQVQKVTGTVV